MSEPINPIKLSASNNLNLDILANVETLSQIDNINLIHQNVNTEIVNITNTASSLSGSTSTLSDSDSININSLGYITSALGNSFENKNAYQLFCEYLKGKHLNEFIDENGNIKYLDWNNFSYNDAKALNPNLTLLQYINMLVSINTSLKHFNEVSDYQLLNLNNNVSNFKIVEVLTYESGFDAIVVQQPNGNYIIIPGATNAKSVEDLSLEGFVVSEYMFDKKIGSILLPAILEGTSEDYLKGLDMNGEEIFYAQINDYYNLVTKYSVIAAENGNNIELNGFSLSGGLSPIVYGLLKTNNPQAANNISAVNVYNSFLLAIKSYNKNNVTSDTIISAIKDDEKVTLYSAVGDFISLFHPFSEELSNNTIFIPAKEIEFVGELFHDIIDDWNFEGSTEIDVSDFIKSIVIMYEFIITSRGNHGLAALDSTAFDENGNIIRLGEAPNINELFAAFCGTEYNGNLKVPDLNFMLSAIIKEPFSWEDLPSTLPNVNLIIEYLCNNVGNFKKNDFLNVVTKCLNDYLTSDNGKQFLVEYFKTVFGDDEFYTLILGVIINDNEFQTTILNELSNFIKNDNNYEFVLGLISLTQQGDTTGINTLIEKVILPNLKYISDESINAVANTLTDIVEISINKVSDDIKKQINKLPNGLFGKIIINTLGNILEGKINDIINEISNLLQYNNNYYNFMLAWENNNYQDILDIIYNTFKNQVNSTEYKNLNIFFKIMENTKNNGDLLDLILLLIDS